MDQGVDPHAKDKLNQTPIYYTARDGKIKCTQYLLEKGSLINEKDFYLQTPIYYAARENQLEILKLLIENKADLNLEDKYGQTCIFYAIKEGHYDIVKTLIDQGADFNKKDKKKLTPYTYALKYHQNDIAELLHSLGAEDISGKVEVKDKKKSKKKSDPQEDQENLEPVPKRFLFVKINSDGTKNILTNEEYEEFKNNYKDIIEILKDEEKLKKFENDVPQRYLNLYYCIFFNLYINFQFEKYR